MTHLVDTDVVIAWLKGNHQAVALLRALPPQSITMSVVTFGDVYEGIYFGRDSMRHERVFRRFCRDVRILNLNRTVCREYARLSGTPRRQGLLLPPQDLFIAATAITYRLTLVTYNRRHFTRVPGLTVYP